MKGFGIYVKNSLLDPKHVVSMGSSVWLYMWLLDAMTSVTEDGIGSVLGGKPVIFQDIEKDLGLTRTTYVRYVTTLRKHGYINTVRTPVGLVITVNKAEKIFKNTPPAKPKSDVPKTDIISPKVKSDVAKMDTDVPKTDIQYKTIQRQYNNKSTNVDLAEAHGKAEINDLFEYWEQTTGIEITSRVLNNRRACYNLLRRHGVERLKRLIDGVAQAQADRYAPRISSFESLQQKYSDLIVWGKQRAAAKTVEVIS